ncbi:MAG: glycosyltransferase family 4 protein [Candidatus Glassbacteria bacterium]
MRIVYVLPVYWPAVGECGIYTHELVRHMSGNHDVRVITQINSQKDKLKAERKSPFCPYLWFGTTAASQGPWSYTEAGAHVHLLKVGELSRIWLYPLVRYHHRFPDLSFNLLKAFFGRKMDGKMKRCDIIHSVHGGVSYLGHAAYDIARMKGVPFVYTPVLRLVNGALIEEYKKHRGKIQELPGEPPDQEKSFKSWHYRYWIELCSKADALITMTKFEKDFFVGEGVEAERIFPLGAGPLLADEYDSKAFRESYNLSGKSLVLFLGRNHIIKGMRELLEAAPTVWEKHPDTEFLFVGPLEGDAQSEYAKHKDPRIHVLGELSLEEKTSVLEACDLLCLPSLNEGFATVFLEAWYFGKPVIGGDIPPVRELVEDGKGGYLVTPQPGEIANRICKLLDDRDLSMKMGEWGRRRVMEEYTWDKIAEKLEGVYERFLNGELTFNPKRLEEGDL